MKLNISIHKIYITFLLILLPVSMLSAQDTNNPNRRNYTLLVKNEAGKPLDEVSIIVGEGVSHAWTNNVGTADFMATDKDFITIYKQGFKKKIFSITNIPQEVILTEALLFKSDDDGVAFPFLTYKRRDITSSEFVLRGNDLESYPTSDLRNAFVGLVPGLDIIERNGSPVLSALEKAAVDGITPKVNMSMRGYKPIFIVDGLEVDIAEMPLDPQEIESVTFVKDIISKAMYGPKGGDGIINIKTKRGKQNERIVNASIESGISMVDRFPEWVSGAEYAELNNLARKNSGMNPLYSADAIAKYALNDPYDLLYPSIDFKQMLWKDTRPFMRANVSSSGGNNWVKYYAYIGYNHEGDNFNIGPNSDYNRINARSNIDVNVTKDLKVSLGIYGGVTIKNAPSYASTVTNTEMELLLEDMRTVPPIAFPVYASNEEGNNPWYAVSSNYSRNPIGSLEACGYYKEQTRSSAANIALDYDFTDLIPGLKSRTFLSFNLLNLTRIGKLNNYIAYMVNPTLTPEGEETIELTKVHDGVDNTDQSKILDYYYQRLAFHQSLSYDKAWGDHEMQLGLIYSLFNGMKDSRREPDRQQNGIFTAMYSFQNKYSIEGALNYAGTSSFKKGKRYNLFPALGLSWVISDENFLQNTDFLDFLKLRVNGGILGYDGLATAFYYQDRWSTASSIAPFGPHSANQWFGSSTETVSQTYPNRIANEGLTWEKRKEFSAGLDALMFDRKLHLEFNYYNNIQDGVIAKMNYMLPYITGYSSASPWVNYNKFRYYGAEFYLAYSGKSADFKYRIAANANIRNSKVLKYDEPNYRESYLSYIGKSKDAIAGYTYVGRYASDSEAQAVIQNFDETLSENDLKYHDKNNDGVIDENDISYIGHDSPRLIYGLNVKLEYKNFELNITGSGRAFYDIIKSNTYFRNGSGDNTYSKYVKDNIDGAYPRLTYQRINNNFQTSEFWLANGSFFKLQNMELAYNLRLNNKGIGIQFIRFHLRGANLFTISELKDVDPESIDSGITMYPLFRTFTGGLTMSF
ncbi:SusC/RagA family TonB-linked outer membrane protein [Parabacteroides sp. Marseille-P3160]|uniref:SusC/RagA family TonB-linked outer membrane protein n=1 Tax=Parabacteroides sp. Marseille-P3160 TaxID=1917887 RepID=UPI001119031D|nr:SusC/RagA family TonB-linked outer membrane protein [Parabacteroides sp. Marseille-P3160]